MNVMKLTIGCCLCLFFAIGASAQYNIIPNHGFEVFNEMPTRWNRTGADFNGILKNWESPNMGSPDIYNPKISIPPFWESKGVGYMNAVDGQTYVGLTLFGCAEGGKPHCREYLQVQLTEPLVPSQYYELSMYVSSLPRGYRINSIGAAFLEEKIWKDDVNPLEIRAKMAAQNVVEPKSGEWQKLTFRFNAKTDRDILLIGNLFDDESTDYERVYADAQLKFAYYYFDNIVLRKMPPYLEVEEPEDYVREEIKVEVPVILPNVYFDFDKATFKPESYITLNRLLEFLQSQPDVHITIMGHTDNAGSDTYNKKLSTERAKAVYDYLIDHNIDANRLKYEGFGEEDPLEDNDSELGRATNRRVAFKIDAM